MSQFISLCLTIWHAVQTGAPRAKRGPGACSNTTDFRFREVQNRRRICCSLVRKLMWSQKKKKKVFTETRWSPKKKKVFTKIWKVLPVETRWSQKKVFRASHANLSMSFRWAPLQLMSPRLGPLKPTAFLKPMGPLMGPQKSMCPGVIVPFSAALGANYQALTTHGVVNFTALVWTKSVWKETWRCIILTWVSSTRILGYCRLSKNCSKTEQQHRRDKFQLQKSTVKQNR